MIQDISPCDVIVFDDLRRTYRFNQDIAQRTDVAQVHAVGSPDYKTEVAEMRRQVHDWQRKFGVADLGEIKE